jgi:hypothetical protein
MKKIIAAFFAFAFLAADTPTFTFSPLPAPIDFQGET